MPLTRCCAGYSANGILALTDKIHKSLVSDIWDSSKLAGMRLRLARVCEVCVPRQPRRETSDCALGWVPRARPAGRHERSTAWFQLYRRGGRVILHHGHIQPVLIRAWSPVMDGITATIWASQTTLDPGLAV